MYNQVVELFEQVGASLHKQDIAEVFPTASYREDWLYNGQNVHAFYRGIWNTTAAIYLKGHTSKSNDSELVVSGRLIEDHERYEITKGLGTLDEIERVMERIDRIESDHLLPEMRLPYNSTLLEQRIFEAIPLEALGHHSKSSN